VPVVVQTAVDLATPALGEPGGRPATLFWYALWTNSQCEQLVHDQLLARGFDPFLPRVGVWSRRRGARRVVSVPLFSGYLFLRHPAMTKADYIEICRARGLVRLLGARWDQLEIVPDGEMNSIRTVLDARVPVMPHLYLRDGERVRIVRGPLTGVEGILVRTKLNKGLIVLRVALLRRSVAVEVDCTIVTPA
jgi:transcription termination/antitermination protein NusG